ncbi:hypothetical protein SAMN05428642_102649 [Flaviramulus basaltis]|uniref:Copper chaperone CopZ n=1 Tax=Flaviramulus basaltis TaxID=369401 RepID=A0A1K2IJ39_9FLAO|nr:heavy metal transporter [Flaviramulus basaltis]SFZ92310.1 hypothetical protein SAMN05428642_102649 [Flaviramulus basaltis]
MRTKVHIQNLKYDACKVTIVNKLSEVKNISGVEVDQDEETVSFDYYTHHDFDRAKHILSIIGYPVLGADNKL